MPLRFDWRTEFLRATPKPSLPSVLLARAQSSPNAVGRILPQAGGWMGAVTVPLLLIRAVWTWAFLFGLLRTARGWWQAHTRLVKQAAAVFCVLEADADTGSLLSWTTSHVR